MMTASKVKGFTLIEVMIGIAILSMLVAIALPPIFERLQMAKVESSITQASNIAAQCDIARRKPVSSTRNPLTLQVVHNYSQLPNWSTIATLEGLLAGQHSIPRVNPFGKPFLVRFDEQRCYVAIDLDFREDGIAGQQTQTVGGNTRIIISGLARGTGSTEWVKSTKKAMFNEISR